MFFRPPKPLHAPPPLYGLLPYLYGCHGVQRSQFPLFIGVWKWWCVDDSSMINCLLHVWYTQNPVKNNSAIHFQAKETPFQVWKQILNTTHIPCTWTCCRILNPITLHVMGNILAVASVIYLFPQRYTFYLPHYTFVPKPLSGECFLVCYMWGVYPTRNWFPLIVCNCPVTFNSIRTPVIIDSLHECWDRLFKQSPWPISNQFMI